MALYKTGVVEASRFSTNGILEDMEIKYFENAVWAKVFEHNNHAGTVLFTSIDEVKKSNTADKYSRIYLLDYLKASDGKFEFLLEYPDDIPNQYNRWKQTNNPCNEHMESGTRPVTGYEAVHIDWDTSLWGGLERSNSNVETLGSTYIDGSVGHVNWHYAIGTKSAWNGGIPGPSTSPIIYGRVQLWVRIDTLPEETKCQISKSNCVVANDFYEI